MFSILAVGFLATTLAVAEDRQQPTPTPAPAREPRFDQTVPVTKGARLDLSNYAGEIVVRGWDKDAVRVEAEHSSRDTIDVKADESLVRIRSRSRLGPSRAVDYRLTVPKWMALKLSGVYADMILEDIGGEATVETVKGEIRVKGGAGFLSLRSVQGGVTVEGARGRIKVASVNEGIRLVGAAGEIAAETTNGDIVLERIDSDNVDVGTVNGDVTYDGVIRDNGRYLFTTHNGDVSIAVPEKVNATVSVRTFNGDFESSFNVPVNETRPGRRLSFTLGTGSAQIELESFGGMIRLRRPGEPTRRVRKEKDRHDDRDPGDPDLDVKPTPEPRPKPIPKPKVKIGQL